MLQFSHILVLHSPLLLPFSVVSTISFPAHLALLTQMVACVKATRLLAFLSFALRRGLTKLVLIKTSYSYMFFSLYDPMLKFIWQGRRVVLGMNLSCPLQPNNKNYKIGPADNKGKVAKYSSDLQRARHDVNLPALQCFTWPSVFGTSLNYPFVYIFLNRRFGAKTWTAHHPRKQ